MEDWIKYVLMASGMGLQFSLFYCIYGMKVKNIGRALASAGALFIVFALLVSPENQTILLLALSAAWCLLSIDASVPEVLRLVFLNVLMMVSVEMFLEYVILLPLLGDRVGEQLLMLVNEFLILGLIWIKKIFFPNRVLHADRLGKSLYALLCISLGMFLFFSSGIVYALGIDSNYRVHWIAIFALCVSCVVECIFCAGAIVLINQKEQLRMYLHMENQFRKEQEQYYLKLLEKDEETRSFRHDIIGQLVGIRAQLESGQSDLAQAHIDSLCGEITRIQRKLPDVGNDMINAILSYYLGTDDFSVEVTGRLNRAMPIQDADLCIIVSNLVKNAAEAARQIEGEKSLLNRMKKLSRQNFCCGADRSQCMGMSAVIY